MYYLAVLVLLLADLRASAAHADSAEDHAPWHTQASADARTAAIALFDQGVILHEQLLFTEAVDKYEAAVRLWDHPDYRWNLALAYRRMGNHLRAYQHIEQARKWGQSAFSTTNWQQMQDLRQEFLRDHLAVVDVDCTEPGTAVSLSGEHWFVGPGSARKVLAPGQYVITAEKAGFFSVVRSLTLVPGKRGHLKLAMDIDGTFSRRKWPAWKPRAVAGVGLGLGVLGAALLWQAERDFASATATFQFRCGDDVIISCPPNTPTAYRRAVWEERIAWTSLAAGGAAVAVGTVLMIWNRPRSYRTEEQNRSRFELVPNLSGQGVELRGRLRF